MHVVRLRATLVCLVIMLALSGCAHILKVTDSRDPIPAGWIVEYTVRVTNPLPTAVAHALVEAQMPYGTVFVDADQGGVRQGRKVVWNYSGLPAGATRLVHFRVRPYSTTRGYISTRVMVGDVSSFPFVWADAVREYTHVVAP